MGSRLVAVCFTAGRPPRLAEFWSGLLGWEQVGEAHGCVALLPGDDTGFRIRFTPGQELGGSPTRMHFDLTSASPQNQRRTVAGALALGARHLDVGQRWEEGHVVLADPEGNAFCVIEAGNAFLADCGFVGALACDGTQRVGYFWSEALDWPLVWDRDQETAIRSPHGGPKLTWGGPPVPPRTGRNRVHFDLAPTAPDGLRAEVERLIALGATRVGAGPDAAGRVEMADPDGNEFCVLAPR